MANFRPNLRPFIDWRPTPGYTEPYLTFTRASTAYEIDSTGTLVSKGTDVLRDRFNPDTLAYEGKWIEPAGTNLCLQSEVMGTTWTQFAVSIGSNVLASPDGNTTADSIIEDGASAVHANCQSITKAASAIEYTFSCFLKAGARSEAWLAMDDGATTNYVNAHFDLSAGTVDGNVKAGNFTVGTASITAYPNGWYRCEISGTTNTVTTVRACISMDDGGGANYITSYAGDGASLLYAWGAQVETGAKASSYVKTTTTAVTRAADVCSIDLTTVFTDHNLNTEGTVYCEFIPYIAPVSGSLNRTPFSLHDGATNESHWALWWESNNKASVIVTDGGAGQAAISGGTPSVGSAYKMAYAFKVNDFSLSTNGSAVATDTSGTLPTIDAIHIGSLITLHPAYMGLKRLVFYNKRVPDADLINISTAGRTAYWRLPRDKF